MAKQRRRIPVRIAMVFCLAAAGTAPAQTVRSDPVSTALAEVYSKDYAAALQRLVVGRWKLISFYEEDEFGEEDETFGLSPVGRLSFDPSGRFEFEIKDDYGFNRCVRWTGTFAIAPDSAITFRLEAPELRSGGVRRAELHVDATSLGLTSVSGPSLAGALYSHTLWERVPGDAKDLEPVCAPRPLARARR